MNKWFGKQAIGRWCRGGAWLVVVFYLAEIVALIFSRQTEYAALFSTSTSLFDYFFVTLVLQPVLSVITSMVFYFLVLYAIGHACDHFFGQAAPARSAAYFEEDEVLNEPLFRE